MRRLASIGAIMCAFPASADDLEPRHAKLRPVPFTAVKIEDEFWAPRLKVVAEKTLAANFRQCEQTGRIRNWEKAARALGRPPAGAGDAEPFEGYFFNDSDVYKAMEGAAYVLHHFPDATYAGRPLDEYLDELIGKIADMQWPDGYVNSYFTLKRGQEQRWTDIQHKHELYCGGHLIEAAVAHFQVTGQRNFLDVAIRLADHIGDTFGPEPGKKADPCGHPEVELALLKLAELCADVAGAPRGREIPHPSAQGGTVSRREAVVAGNTAHGLASPDRATQPQQSAARYFKLASFFIEQHGRKDGRERLWGDYAQDHVPLRQQREIVGHAVRAMYFYSAATDIAARTADAEYLTALDSVWRDLTQRKMYITGGIGPSSHNEGFTVPYDLPNDTAYAETCGSIGLAFWAQRMNLLHGQAQYADVLERVLYNGLLSGLSLAGEQFFYENRLGSRGEARRRDWFGCACCPPNLLRFLPTVGGYAYAVGDDAIYVNQYIGSTATIRLRDDLTVTIRQETRYPWDGRVRITVTPSKSSTFGLYFRRPEWCNHWTVGSRPSDIADALAPLQTPSVDYGYLGARREWKAGDSFEVTFDMPIRRMESHPRVKANVGRVALQRGPIVYCLEGTDNVGRVRNVCLPRDAELMAEQRPDLLGGVIVIRGKGLAASSSDEARAQPALYQPVASVQARALVAIPSAVEPKGFVAIPYFAWANREPGEMVVWLPESPALVEPGPVPWITPSASHCWENDSVLALCDRIEPSSSADHSVPRFTWWPQRGTSERVQYDFDQPRRVSAVELYWFDDVKAGGHCCPPESWRLLYRKGGQWYDVGGAAGFGTEPDRYNRVAFAPVETDGLRIEAKLREGFSAGILEWRVESAE